jgi:hypothetical protein
MDFLQAHIMCNGRKTRLHEGSKRNIPCLRAPHAAGARNICMIRGNLPMRGSALFAPYYLLRILPSQNHALW